jgi:hypothetical protein
MSQKTEFTVQSVKSAGITNHNQEFQCRQKQYPFLILELIDLVRGAREFTWEIKQQDVCMM